VKTVAEALRRKPVRRDAGFAILLVARA